MDPGGFLSTGKIKKKEENLDPFVSFSRHLRSVLTTFLFEWNDPALGEAMIYIKEMLFGNKQSRSAAAGS